MTMKFHRLRPLLFCLRSILDRRFQVADGRTQMADFSLLPANCYLKKFAGIFNNVV